MTLVKLCGLMRAEDAAAANNAHPDLAGMILSPGFRRSISHETAGMIRHNVHDEIELCGVFVNADIQEIISYLNDKIIDTVQLHGREDNAYIDQLKQLAPSVRVIKAFVVHGPEEIECANHSHADLVLLDGGTGEGRGFDPALLTGIRRPYILAGGLNPETVGDAVRHLHPYGVDTSSGIETDRVKDPEKMNAFVQAVRSEDRRR